jgi:hypothetical protein
MSKMDKIITEEYIPHLIESVYPKIQNELPNWGKQDFTEFLTAFEKIVKKRRDRLIMHEVNYNLN